MKNGTLQYISDSILIENLAAMEFGIIKEAGVLDMLGGVASSIKNTVQQQISPDSPGGVVGGVLRIMEPAVLFRLNPIVGILDLIASAFGFSITSVIVKIIDSLKPKLLNGDKISPEEVNDIGKGVVASEAGDIGKIASNDMLAHLRTINFRHLKLKIAQTQTLPKVPWLSGGGGSPIQSIFGQLFQTRQTGKAKWLLGGFIVWIIKTILAGAGLLAITGVVSNMLGHKPGTGLETKHNEDSIKNEKSDEIIPVGQKTKVEESSIKGHLQSSGHGEQVFSNDANNIWVIPLINSNVKDTLVAWTADIYPSLQGHDNLIESSSTFQKMVNLLEMNHKSTSPNNLVVPKGYNSRKQIVDFFVGDIAGSL